MQFLEGSPAPEGPPEGGPADQYQHHGMEIDEGGPPNGHGHPGAHMVLMQPPPGHQGFVGDPREQQFQGQTVGLVPLSILFPITHDSSLPFCPVFLALW